MRTPIFVPEAYLLGTSDSEVQNYYVDFVNESERVWTMGIYQTYPDSVGLESVSWLQTRAANGGETGVAWKVEYQAMLADYKQPDGRGVYKASQRRNTLLGRKWRVDYEEGVQQLFEDGEADRPDQVIIANQSGERANTGIGMSGQGSVFKRDVFSGSSAQFIVKPTYWMGLFNDLVRGEVIGSNVMVGPQKLVFEGGRNLATVTARIIASSITVDIQYSTRAAASLKAVDEHALALNQIAYIEGDRRTQNTLRPGAPPHPWKKHEYSRLSFDWADPHNPGNGKCSVKLGDRAHSYSVPQQNLAINGESGSLTNNTDKTITYCLE